jgi:kinesin family protein 11
VKQQVEHLDTEMQALDGIVDRIQEQNNAAHESRERSFKALATTAQASYHNIEGTFAASFDRVEALKSDVFETTNALQETLPTLDVDAPVRKPLMELRERLESDKLEEYVPTGHTPARKEYQYSRTVSRTADRGLLIDRLRNGFVATEDLPKSPSKTRVFSDDTDILTASTRPGTSSSSFSNSSLRELDVNAMSGLTLPSIDVLSIPSLKASATVLPSLKRPNPISASSDSRGPSKKRGGLRSTMAVGGFLERENVTMPNLSASVGMGSTHPVTGRRLRSRDRQVS